MRNKLHQLLNNEILADSRFNKHKKSLKSSIEISDEIIKKLKGITLKYAVNSVNFIPNLMNIFQKNRLLMLKHAGI